MHNYLKHLMTAGREADELEDIDISASEAFMAGYNHAIFILEALCEQKETTAFAMGEYENAISALIEFRNFKDEEGRAA